ncbi:sensor histidine kinase [Lacrimispora brassicae]
MKTLIYKILKSLQVRIVIVLIIFIFIPFFSLLSYNFSKAEKRLIDKKMQLLDGNIIQIKQNIENILENSIKLSNILTTDKTLLSNLKNTVQVKEPPGNLYDLTNFDVIAMINIEARLSYAKSNMFYNYATDVMVLGMNGIAYCSNDMSSSYKAKQFYLNDFAKQGHYSGINENSDNIVWQAPFVYGFDQEFQCISMRRRIKDDYSNKTLGVIMINMDISNFKDIISDDMDSITVAVVNEQKEVVYQSNHDFHINEKLLEGGKEIAEIDGQSYLYREVALSKTGWSVVALSDYDKVMKEIRDLKHQTYLISISIFIAILSLTIFVILYITNPIKNLINNIRNMEIGSYHFDESSSRQMKKNFDSDVKDLIHTFDYLIKRTQELVNQVVEEERTKSELKYEMLRAQINPHFLFNTLNTIKWSALMNGNDYIAKLIVELGKLLEVSMNKGVEEITLNEEIDLIKAYIFIQNAKYTDNIKLQISMPEELGECLIGKFLLQPIVENAIVHGLEFQPGAVSIDITQIDDKLSVMLTDTGKGFTPEAYSDETGFVYSGIGLKNVSERIQLKYGSDYGVQLVRDYKEGARILLMLPLLRGVYVKDNCC